MDISAFVLYVASLLLSLHTLYSTIKMAENKGVRKCTQLR